MNTRLFSAFLASSLFATAAVAATITLQTPADGALYDLHSPCVKEFLANRDKRGEKPPRPALTEAEIKARDEQNAKYEAWVAAGKDKATKVKPWEDRYNFYMNNAWSSELMKRAAEEEKAYKPFTWTVADGKLKDIVVEFSKTPDFKQVVTQRVEVDSNPHKPAPTGMRPAFLELGTTYAWRVVAKDETGARVVSNVQRFRTSDQPPRMISVPSTNMRDLGGGVNVDGKRVRQGLLYRGQAVPAKSTLDELRERYINKLGVKTEIDLRSKSEVEERRKQWGEQDLADLGVQHLYHPIIPYHMHYPNNLPEFLKIFEVLSKKENYPVYFHCAVGSDRTGSLAFLLDGVIGRPDEYYYDDYELPSFNVNLPRYRYCRKAQELFSTYAPTETQSTRDRVVEYLLKIGVTQEQIDSIRAIMLEP